VFRQRPGITRRAFLATTAGAALAARVSAQPSREVLYNSITLAQPWPPRRAILSPTLARPPYLSSPPDVINIDVGRQLFVDDFLIEESSLLRNFHKADYHPANPLLTPQQPWEIDDPYAVATKTAPSSAAMVFSDGVFFDPADRLFKMWYMAGYQQHTALATSADGITWTRRNAGVIPGTNIVRKHRRDSSTVWLDLDERDRSARFKMAWTSMDGPNLHLSTSPDGVHWTDRGDAGPVGDRTTCFFNPFRKRWCFSIRDNDARLRRIRRYYESPSFETTRWTDAGPVPWIAADDLDEVREGGDVPAELYNLDAVAYESVMLGLFSIFRGESSDREKPNDLCLGFSRDGFHWSRPEPREAFIGVSERQGDWNWANVQSAGGVCLVVGDRLHFYVSGRAGVRGTSLPGKCSTGLATLRRDGFASLTDVWPAGATRPITRHRDAVITRPVKFLGAHCFVNADVTGSLRVELLDREGKTIPGFSADQCEPINGDRTKHEIRWRSATRLADLENTVVRFKFVLDRARLFAFWVSPSPRGESRGYLGAGGPGYAGTIDS
jgi:hypothetical protein